MLSEAFNLAVLQQEMNKLHSHSLAQATMAKCHKDCILSLDESKLLAHEEACFRNCFVKSPQFNEHFQKEIQYTIRQFDRGDVYQPWDQSA